MVREIASLQHPLVKHLVHVRQNRDYREEHQRVMIQGSKLIAEICPSHHTYLIMTCDPHLIPPGIAADDVLLVSESIMQKVSGLQTSEGIIAEVEMPKPASLKGLGWIIACDGVGDPGNLGALLRTSLALGWEGAFILNNSCDPFNDKALRAAKGATFRLPMAMGSWKDLNKLIKENQLKPLVADMKGANLNEIAPAKNVLLVMSHEGHGVSTEAAKVCEPVSIPMPGEMESLNVAVAGGILMYILRGKSSPQSH